MSNDLFKDYIPEIIEYNEEIDGSFEHKIREEHLNSKEKLLEKVRKAKRNKTPFRQPIRTENEK